jgi:ubiquinol-cytochrome c reductase cytochrome c1 subunit
MPNPLWELQGEQQPLYNMVESHGHEVEVLRGWEQIKPGTMTPAKFDSNVGDLVAYMQWMSEPGANSRIRIGVWVMLFLAVFTLIAWRLNAAFWKDIK